MPIVRPEISSSDHAIGGHLDLHCPLNGNLTHAGMPLAHESWRYFYASSKRRKRFLPGLKVGSKVHMYEPSASLSTWQAQCYFARIARCYPMGDMKTIEEIRRDRLRLLIEEFGSIAAVARQYERDPAQISQWLNAFVDSKSGKPRNMSSVSAREFERKFGKPTLWMDTPTVVGAARLDAVMVPQLEASASMGNGNDSPDEDVLVGHIALKRTFVADELRTQRWESLRFIHAHGDSMEPTLRSGDVLLVDTSAISVDTDGLYVLRAHGRLFVKRVRQRLDGRFEISSDNPAHRTVDVLDGGHDVEVLGRVVWFWNGHRVM